MSRHVVTVGPLATAVANNICTTQTGSAFALTLNGSLVSGGVATLDVPRRVLFTDSGDNTSVSYKVTGTTFAKALVTETVAGTNTSTAYTNTDFATVTSIAIVGASAAPQSLTVGTNGVAGSEWTHLDMWALPSITLQAIVSGTVDYSVQTTLDEPNSTSAAVAIPSVNWRTDLSGIDGSTDSTSVEIQGVPQYIRTLLNSGTGYVTTTISQAGSVTY